MRLSLCIVLLSGATGLVFKGQGLWDESNQNADKLQAMYESMWNADIEQIKPKESAADAAERDIWGAGDSLRGELARPGRTAKQVVEEYITAMKENDSENLVGLMAKTFQIVKHDDSGGTHTMHDDDAEHSVWIKSSSSHRCQDGKNYKFEKEVIDPPIGNRVTVHHYVKKERGWTDARSVFTVSSDGLITQIETFLKRGKKQNYTYHDKDGNEMHRPIPPQAYLPA